MKITKKQLKRIIREEYSKIMEQGSTIMGKKGRQGQLGQVVSKDPTSDDWEQWDFDLDTQGRPTMETIESFFWAAAYKNESMFDRVAGHFGGRGDVGELLDIWDNLSGKEQVKLEKALYAVIQEVDPVYALHDQNPRY